MGEEEENLRALEALLTEFFSPGTDNTRKAAIEKVPPHLPDVTAH